MPRPLRVASAQVGHIDLTTPRSSILSRLISLLDQAAAQSVQLVVFPETTFTTFFPRYFLGEAELGSYYERDGFLEGGENNVLRTFVCHAGKLGLDVVVGYAESTPDIEALRKGLYTPSSAPLPPVLSKYRKVHLPGTYEPFSTDPKTTNQLEKRYFRPGDLGFEAFRAPGLKAKWPPAQSPIVGMLICNDRRWAEGWRCYGLQGVEIMCIGYNTTAWAPELWGSSPDLTREQAREDAMFHHKLVVQANAYTNSTFCITSARTGLDDNHFELISGSMIVSPQGRILAENKTSSDELIVADVDLDECKPGKAKTFCFERHRRVECYGRIVGQRGVVEPPEEA
ncbi:N-carbamoyl-D-amino acid hydrolase [Stereum hirsutum FP-91666 SS1]|uniref:N-carbamoyl-D-amino acid hydrolase n=1 Tax=Stereum hirsutum (strain FP-91666) TaxID=721885 RepID=R7RY76_STEHR|nr:N-carbamoyl-D-amino acid hydrolase [Stereum hirsutum FP-91666 SS1]EIM80356.1 N-carbamoyl-D-amino acid hydrolase [Stereum hirsutum FP-91666 SS1]